MDLKDVSTEKFVSSTVYYDKENWQEFSDLFNRLEVTDPNLEQYLEIARELLANGAFDKVASKTPTARRNYNIRVIRQAIEKMPSEAFKERMYTWFNNGLEDTQLELPEELLKRYCWYEFTYRVDKASRSDTSYEEKLTIRPIVPKESKKQIKSLGEIEIPAEYLEQEKTVYKTGICGLDEMVKMRQTNFVVIAARASVGKSLFMINQALENARIGRKVIYTSFEEDDCELKKRADHHMVKWNDSDRNSALKHFIVYTPNTSSPNVVFDEIRRQLEEDPEIKAVFIDYLQLMKYPNMSDWDSMRVLTREMKLFAVRNNILLVTACQLKRDVEYVGASLASLYGSSTIEADANIVIMLEPSRKRNVRVGSTSSISIVVAKNRAGEQGRLDGVIVDYSDGTICE